MTTAARTTAAPVLVLDWSEALELDRREQEAAEQEKALAYAAVNAADRRAADLSRRLFATEPLAPERAVLRAQLREAREDYDRLSAVWRAMF